MLKTFRTLSTTIRPTTLHYNPSRNFSFNRLIENMDFRTKMRFEMLEANQKTKQQHKRFYQRIYDKAYENRKKLAIFFGFVAMLNLHPVYKGFLQVVRKLEPVKLQLKIWFLGEKNYIPDSIEETFMTREGIRLSPHVNDTLSNLFLDADRDLKYGINKKFLRKLFAKVNCLKTKEERADFYQDSIYNKKLNQKLNGVSLKQFLLTYQEMQKKLRKEEGVSEEEFLKRVVDVWEETKLQTQVWEGEVTKKRNEMNKNQTRRSVEDRKSTIYQLLKDNAFIAIEDLEGRVIERGFHALSLREKVKLLDYQLSQLSQLKNEAGLDRFSMSGESGNLERADEFENAIAQVAQSLKDARTNFTKNFEKPQK